MNSKIIKTALVEWLPIVGLLIFGLLFFNYKQEQSNSEELKKESSNNFTITDFMTGDFDGTAIGDNIYSGEFTFIEDCVPTNTGEYKILNIFASPEKSPLNPRDYVSYTKPFIISGNIGSAKLCVVSDMVDYRKKHQFTYSTYILFNDRGMDGHLNVGFSKKNNVIYDYTSSPNEPFLNGRFRGDETPKIYSNIDLSNVIVADFVNGGSKEINILKRLQQQGPIRIGGFVNAKNGEGIIQKFVIAYKCEDGSDCKIE